MRITVDIPEEHLHNALAAPHSIYWTNEFSWDPVTCTGYVVDVEEDDEPIIELDKNDLERAVGIIAHDYPNLLGRFIAGETDGPDGDTLLQLMAFRELKYA